MTPDANTDQLCWREISLPEGDKMLDEGIGGREWRVVGKVAMENRGNLGGRIK